MEIEKIDEVTNEIMDMIRNKFSLDYESDLDDYMYGFIHSKIKELFN